MTRNRLRKEPLVLKGQSRLLQRRADEKHFKNIRYLSNQKGNVVLFQWGREIPYSM